MNSSPTTYERLERALTYLIEHADKQPSLSEAASIVNLSPYHFQRIFTEWVGVSPKKFVEHLTLSKAKKELLQRKSVETVSWDVGLSSPSRLHDLFVKIEAMTPGEFKQQGKNLVFYASEYDSHFGKVSIVSTEKGICHISFGGLESPYFEDFRETFANATVQFQTHERHLAALDKIYSLNNIYTPIHLHLKGTPFQIKVWNALLSIETGALTSYAQIAQSIHQPSATRAVASAIAKNPIAVLIPCHRVIQSSGIFGEYRWSKTRKATLIGYESIHK